MANHLTFGSGAIFIGKSFDPANSKIEISFSPPQNYRPGVDVSYVDGYSVPITCSCGGVPVTGCNIPLFLQGRTCPQPGPGDKVICYNPKKVINNGPADPFFQPCQGAAYTYPNDHTANAFGKCDSGDIQCCVGVCIHLLSPTFANTLSPIRSHAHVRANSTGRGTWKIGVSATRPRFPLAFPERPPWG